MKNKTIKHLPLFALFLTSTIAVDAQVSESCNCAVDTLGYASFIQTLNPNENAPFQFHVNGTFAVAYGVINSSTPAVVQDLIDNNPVVTTIVMHSCPGSDDDTANLQASMLLYNNGYKMYLPNGGFIASGATDMFLAGSTRVVEITVDPVGVHSWSDGTNDATDFPVGHPYHLPYINYYVNVGFTQQEAEDFYYFTINAAPAAGIHWMTDAEIDQYKIRTCKYSATPVYTVSLNGATLSADLAGAMYQWLDCVDNHSPVIGETNQPFSPTMNGSYAVQVSETGCMDTSMCTSVVVASITDIDFANGLSVYPNPLEHQFRVDLGENNTLVRITLVNMNGKVIQLMSVENSQLVELSLEDEAPGVYLLKLESGADRAAIRLVKL